jgi:hypothetical protein
MRVASLFAWLMTFASMAVAQAPMVCPWLATGSATTVLGGEVTVTAHSENNWDGACRFSRQIEGKTRAIEVQVSKANSRPCPEGSQKINALGNEAVQCRRVAAKSEETDIIAGRVRDVFFAVSAINMPEVARKTENPQSPSDPFGGSLLEKIAEQVAGNLF